MSETYKVLLTKDDLKNVSKSAEQTSFSSEAPEDRQVVSETKNDAAGGLQKSAVAAAVIQSAKTGMMAAISNYGAITGNSLMQNRINTAIDIASKLAIVGANPVIGTPVVLTQVGIDVYQELRERKKAEFEVQRLNQRVGNSNYNGSRFGI